LSQARGNDDEGNLRRKRQKVSVIPGKSVSADDVQEGILSKATSCTKSKKTTKASSSSTGTSIRTSTGTDEILSDVQLAHMIERDEEAGTHADIEPSDDEHTEEASTSSDSEPEASAEDPKPAAVCISPKSKKTGDFVIVDYLGVKYPGVVMVVKKTGAEVSTMTRSGANWKWPSKRDQILYKNSEIVEFISELVKIGRRGIMKVPEMDKYL
jgi:hypothetical protein